MLALRRSYGLTLIHAVFNLHGTETGRLSGSKPNLQNQPRPTSGERLPNIRNLYRASRGYTLIQADYSQAELRMAAVLSGDEALSDIYYTGRDFHSETCARAVTLAEQPLRPYL